MSRVVLSRLTHPRDFDPYLDLIDKAKQQHKPQHHTAQEQMTHSQSERQTHAASRAGEADGDEAAGEEEEEGRGGLDGRLAISPPVSISRPALSASPPPPPLPAGHVSVYAPFRRGFLDPAYAALLHTCSRLIGSQVRTLHNAIYATIKQAKEMQK